MTKILTFESLIGLQTSRGSGYDRKGNRALWQFLERTLAEGQIRVANVAIADRKRSCIEIA